MSKYVYVVEYIGDSVFRGDIDSHEPVAEDACINKALYNLDECIRLDINDLRNHYICEVNDEL